MKAPFVCVACVATSLLPRALGLPGVPKGGQSLQGALVAAAMALALLLRARRMLSINQTAPPRGQCVGPMRMWLAGTKSVALPRVIGGATRELYLLSTSGFLPEVHAH